MRYYEDSERISVHVSESGPIKNLQVFLRDNGFSFDAEGDVTMMYFDGPLLEVREEPGGGLSYSIYLYPMAKAISITSGRLLKHLYQS